MTEVKKNKWVSIIGVVVIISLGVAGFQLLLMMKKAPERVEKVNPGALVEVVKASPSGKNTHIDITGTVNAFQEVTISPQVSGVVVEDYIELGRAFKSGDILFRIDPTDYELAISSANAMVKKAEYDLADMASKARIAKMEWDKISKPQGREATPLVLYEPQMANAEAQLKSAVASLNKARLDLSRTIITAPFNCRILTESMGSGQYLTPGSPVATIIATDAVDIIAPILVYDLAWLKMSGAALNPPMANIVLPLGDERFEWPGKVIRMLGNADDASRMMRLLIRVQDPYNFENKLPSNQPPLVPGMFVTIGLDGPPVNNSWVIPSDALKDNDSVWVMDDNHQLEVRTVNVLRKEKGQFYVSGNIDADTRLIVTHITGAANGMPLREMTKGGQP